MQIGLHNFSSETIEWFKEAVKDPRATRYSPARELCERDDWRNSGGELCTGSARKILPRIADKVKVTLPEAKPLNPGMVPGGAAPAIKTDYPDVLVNTDLERLGVISLEIVEDKEKRLRRGMMRTHHPEGWSRVPGRRICYWITSALYGRVGGIGFCAASRHQAARDKWIGWSSSARVKNLDLVVNNHRFLLLPGVRVKNLASRVLSTASRRVVSDWEELYGLSPVLAYSYISSDREGTSYRAAGWEMCGEKTSGRPPGKGTAESRTVWMKPLSEGWEQKLLEEPVRKTGTVPEPYYAEDTDWAYMEYCRSSYPDARVRELIISAGGRWADNPGKSVPEMFPQTAERKAVYRLLSNPRVKMEDILEPHKEAMVSRCRLENVVLAVQDTTTLNYTGLEDTRGLVKIGGGGRGISAHVGLAITEGRRPLGVYEFNTEQRGEKDEAESGKWMKGLLRAREIREACGGTRVISVCDREADIWEFLQEASENGDEVVVRSKKGNGRCVVEDGEKGKECLWKYMEKQPVLGRRTIEIRACGGKRKRDERKAELEIRAVGVRVVPPMRESSRSPIEVLGVSVYEPQPPEGQEGLHWVLLSTEGEAVFECAERIVKWYEARWTVEEYFKVLKSGLSAEKKRFDDVDDLRRSLAFDAVTAYRVFELERLARDKPEVPADKVMTGDEVDVLYKLLRHERIIKSLPAEGRVPDIRTYVIDLARYAGFAPTKRQPLPGTRKLWQGYVKFKIAYMAFLAGREDKLSEQSRGP